MAINWNGVIGSVASVINTALPLFLGGATRAQIGDAEATTAVQIGPATLFKDGGVMKIGNFGTGDGSPNVPLLINFTSPEGDSQENLAVQLAFGQAFAADPWLEQYTYGDTSLGVSQELATDGLAAPGLTGLFTFVTSTVARPATAPITAVLNPELTLLLELRLETNKQVVAVTANGEIGYLVGQYVATAVNNGGQSGTRSGTLQPDPNGKTEAEDGADFIMQLPSGIDYSEGIYQLQLQLPINLEPTSVATHPDVMFETVAPERIAALRYV